MKPLYWSLIGIAALLLFGGSTYLMIDRHTNQELWGHLPLFQFSSFWLLCVYFFRKRWAGDQTGWRYLKWSTITAVLLSLGFPPVPLPFLLVIGFVPLLFIEDAVNKTRKKPALNLFWYAFHAFLLWNIFTTFWVANTAYAAGIFANVVNALLMTIPVLLYHFIKKHLGLSIALAAFVASWVTFEFLHMRWELYWPWLTLGNGLSTMHWGIQWYSFTGVFGGSIWILSINYLLFRVFQSRNQWRIKTLWPALLLVLLPMLISGIMYVTYEEAPAPIEVVSVQPNLEPHYEKFDFPGALILEKLLRLAGEQVDENTDYVIFPETSFSNIDLDRFGETSVGIEMKHFLDPFPNLKLISGLSGGRYLSDPAEIALPTTRPSYRGEDTTYIESYNCAIQIDRKGDIQEYYKALYVPGAEYFPFKKILFFFKPLVNQLGGSVYGYRIRTKGAVFSSEKTTVASPICYESIFGEFNGNFVKKGAKAIFIITNDGWWDKTSGHRQHALFARLRSIELRRSIARSANLGTCCFINQRGDISQQTAYQEVGAIKGTINLNDKITFYARWGDFLGRISLFMSIVLFLRAFVKRILKN
jgi:apolipoprotein N-acyltransferase